MYLDKAKEAFQQLLEIQSKGRKSLAVRPCTPTEVEVLEIFLGISLPAAYREFLLWTGNGGGIFYEFQFQWNYVRDSNRNAAMRIIEYNSCCNELPDDAVIFLVFQDDDAFVFICASEGNDPSVHALMPTQHGYEWKWNYAQNIEAFCLMYINPLLN